MSDGKPDVQEFYKLAESALRTQQELESKFRVFESNEPLTLDELRTMDGEPVRLSDGRCFIVNKGLGFEKHGLATSIILLADIGLYRRKPEEVTE